MKIFLYVLPRFANFSLSPRVTQTTNTNNHIMTTTTKNTIATLKNLITMIEIDHASACEFAEYDCLNLIPDTKEAKIIHLQNLIIAELESAIA